MNAQILAKLEQAFHEDAVHPCAVEKWAARFRSDQMSVEDEERCGRAAQNDFHDAVL
jgi:hypothetical protein